MSKKIAKGYIWSDSLSQMVVAKFKNKRGETYSWNDSDCLYYNDNGDEEDWYMEIPESATIIE